MKLKSPLFSLCINAFLLSVFVGRSNGGVANLCEQGKYFDTSKQEYRPCSECKSEIQECFSCCHSETEIQGMIIFKLCVLFGTFYFPFHR